VKYVLYTGIALLVAFPVVGVLLLSVDALNKQFGDYYVAALVLAVIALQWIVAALEHGSPWQAILIFIAVYVAVRLGHRHCSRSE
jgi:hypothetical protein